MPNNSHKKLAFNRVRSLVRVFNGEGIFYKGTKLQIIHRVSAIGLISDDGNRPLYVSKRANFCEVKQFCVKYGGWDAKRIISERAQKLCGV